MRLTQAILVIVDISGYTRFVSHPAISLLHAEEIISELIESVIDQARHPLTVNKLEGDAALLYRELDGLPDPQAVNDVLGQVHGFFDAFCSRLQQIAGQRAGCPCDACRQARELRLKAFVHAGEIAVKHVRQFTELAGGPVVVVHRLLKNQVAGDEYVLLTEAVRQAGRLPAADLLSHREPDESLRDLPLWVASPSQLPAAPGSGQAAQANRAATRDGRRQPRRFHHVPTVGGGYLRLALARLGNLFRRRSA